VLKDLPKKTERIEWCEMTPLQRSIYNDALQRSRKILIDTELDSVESTPGSTDEGQTKTTKKNARPNHKSKNKVYLENSTNVLMDLRKAASHPMLFRTHFTDQILTGMTTQLMREPDFKKRQAVFEFVKEDMEVMTDAELQAFCGTYKVGVASIFSQALSEVR
jgi:SWI/SNF-related matrix-associated actin-dependent regulator 1 of chromatin subfamily A